MPSMLFILQLALPIGLLGWLAADRTPGPIVFWVRVVATAAVLATIALVAPWTMPPWWTPYFYGCVLAGLVFVRLRSRGPRRTSAARQALQWIATAPLVALAVYGLGQTWQAIEGRRPPAADGVRIGYPLGPGRYIVENGGTTLALNGHMHTANPNDPLYATERGQAYALDIVAMDRFGFRSSGFWPSDPSRYVAFGLPVLAPCDGNVVIANDGNEDQLVPDVDTAAPAGNHVVLECANVHIVLAHLQRGSVAVSIGDSVVQGAHLGRIGNSGASTEPHLHIHAERASTDPSATSGEPLWLWLNGHFLARNSRFTIPHHP